MRRRKRRMCAGKMRFRDKRQATRVLHNFQSKSERAEIPRRAYYCTACRGYHLTSKELLSGGESYEPARG
jgi:hypothetical protein